MLWPILWISATVTLEFEYTATYPDEIPVISISETEGLDEFDVIEQLTASITEQVF